MGAGPDQVGSFCCLDCGPEWAAREAVTANDNWWDGATKGKQFGRSMTLLSLSLCFTRYARYWPLVSFCHPCYGVIFVNFVVCITQNIKEKEYGRFPPVKSEKGNRLGEIYFI